MLGLFECPCVGALQTARQAQPSTAFARNKSPDAVTQVQTALPTIRTQQLAARPSLGTVQVFAQDEPRLALLPVVRRRIPAGGVQPIATVLHQCDNFYLYGAVEPSTGASFFLDLPSLHSRAFQRWVDGFAAPLPESLPVRVLDNGAGHTAKAVRWPCNVVPVVLPPSSPELTPIARLWRDLKEKLADVPATTVAALSDAMCAIIQSYSPAPLHSLTSFTYFVPAVETVQQGLYA
jgi:DDE superfamily endonuclease